MMDTTDNFHHFFSNSIIAFRFFFQGAISIASTDSSTTSLFIRCFFFFLADAPSSSFIPPSCPDQNIGTNCNISSAPCDILKPCQNNGSCNNTNTTLLGYNCTCPPFFNGTQCQFDNRPCKPSTCWNNGIIISLYTMDKYNFF